MNLEEIEKICSHWGCGLSFNEKSNTTKACHYHWGHYEFGSVHGWWPEGWTCCRRHWEAEGCRYGKHEGVPAQEQMFLCINHGEVGKSKNYPDSFCGMSFTKKNAGVCRIHSGYIMENKITGKQVWTCCKSIRGGSYRNNIIEDVKEATPCSELSHKSANYPDEEAKIYFFNKPLEV